MAHPTRWLALCALISGCASVGGQVDADASRRFPQLKSGSQIILHQPLNIEPGWARVFLQGGRVVRHREIDKWSTRCSFEVLEVQQPGAEQQTIQPDRFTIGRTHWRYSASRAKLALAGLWPTREAPTTLFYRTRIELSSALQPQVLRLQCVKRVDDALDAYQPPLGEIRRVLGRVASIELAS